MIKDIFRKYPNKYESIISTLCENLDSLDEPEARCVHPCIQSAMNHVSSVVHCTLLCVYKLFTHYPALLHGTLPCLMQYSVYTCVFL